MPLILSEGLSGHMFLELKHSMRQSVRHALPELAGALENKHSQYHSPAIPLNYQIAEVIRKLRYDEKNFDPSSTPLLGPAIHLLSEFTEGYRKTVELSRSPQAPYKDAFASIRNEILYAPNIQNQTLARLARKYGLSGANLWKGFYNFFGTTLTAFAHETAMEKARLLLTTTTLPIQVIATDLGYSQEKNFSRSFRQYFKMSPQPMRLRLGSGRKEY